MAAEDAGGGEPPSLVRSLFLGRIDDDLAVPFPRLAGSERSQVDQLIDDLRSYCAEHYDAQRIEAERWVPEGVLRDLGEMGLLGLYVPERYGGGGLSQTGYCTVFDAVGQIDATLAVVLGVHQSIGYKGIHLFGTDEQKERFLPGLATGRTLAAYALTETGAGSDAYHLETRARLQPDGSYRLDGEKRYIGNGSRAGVLTVFARTDEGAHVALLVESGMEGFEVGERFDTMGLAGNDLRRLRFRDVHVPAANVLGEEGDGFRIATEVLNNGRMSLGSGSTGAVRHLLALTTDHVRDRRQFGRPLAEFELVRHKVAWMTSYLYGMEAMGYLTTGLVDRGASDYRIESALVKVAGTEFLWYAANRAFQLAGGHAYMRDAPYEKILRDIRIFPIFEGANDVMRLFVALQGLKTVADEVEDLADIDVREPFQAIGTLVGYLGGRVQRRLAPDRVEGAHPRLAERADPVTGQVHDLRAAAEGLLRRHGAEVQEQQGQLKRLAHAALDIYAQIATVSRASTALAASPAATAAAAGAAGPDGEAAAPSANDEGFVADVFCRRAEARTRRWLDQLGTNDDDAMGAIADLAFRGGFGVPT
ncbi:MAG TPA: acyl-CoA dehydrogenase family protein [Acidimicrobiales bacterium]